jgi:hypothetical protein
MTDIKQTATLVTPRRGFFTRVAGVVALGAGVLDPNRLGVLDDVPEWRPFR